MDIRASLVLALIGLTAFGLTACGTSREAGWPEERPLGAQSEPYRPAVAAQMETADSTAQNDVMERIELDPLAGDTLSLNQAVALALGSNTRLREFGWEVRSREAARLQAGLYPNPRLGLESEGLDPSAPVSDFPQAEQAARLRIPLTLSGMPWKQKELAAQERDLAGWDYEAARLDVLTRTRKTYYATVGAQARVELSRQLVRLAETIYESVSRQVETGEKSPVERTRARVPLSRAQIEFDRARNHLESVRSRLAGNWQTPREIDFAGVSSRFPVLEAPPSIDRLRSIARQNPLIARQDDELQRAQAALSVARADRWPEPTVMGGWQRFGGQDRTALAVGIGLELPLFDRNQGSVERARYEIEQAHAARQSARTRVDTALTGAYQNYESARQEVERIRQETLPAARSAFESIRQGYQEGKFGYLEVLDAQRTFFEVRRQEIRALVRLHKARAELERIVASPLEDVSR